MPTNEVVYRVLVIDDNVETANGVREILALEGYQAEAAYGGEHGLARARTFLPDIVLCDITMPEINGLEVARMLRADPALGHAKLVAFTGRNDHSDVVAALAAGFDTHIAKPVLVDELLDALSKLITSAPARTD
jgi:CheY-like chemotaxis protein